MLKQQTASAVGSYFRALFYGAHSVARPYSVDGREQVNDDDEQMRINTHALSGTRTYGLSVQGIKAHVSDREATGTSHAVC
jgi:hypothetical protein